MDILTKQDLAHYLKVSIRPVQELQGHSSISVTETVSHLSTGFKKQDIDLLDYNQNNPSGF